MRYFVLYLSLIFVVDLAAPAETIIFRGARVHPIAAEPIDNGTVVIRDGEIDYVGPSEGTPNYRAAVTHDLTGKVIIPGLVDTHSHLGRVSGGDQSSPLNPEVRALDAVDVHDASMWRARSGGLTTINVMPGSGHLMSGQTVYLKLRSDPQTIEDWLFCEYPETGICGSMKMANGTNSMRSKPFPGTRAKSASMVRELFLKAEQYRDKLSKAAAKDDAKSPDRDLAMEALVQILDRERRVQFHTHRHNDIATMLRLREEFGFDVVIQHGTESWMHAEALARAGVGVSFTLVDSPGGKEEIMRMRMDAPAILEQAGVEISLNTDDYITDSRLFLRTAAIAARHGMTREGALRAVTLTPARQLGLDDRIGSLEKGKDGDLVVLSGDPLSVHTEVLETWVEGQQVYDATNPEHEQYVRGGYRVYPRTAANHHEACWR